MATGKVIHLTHLEETTSPLTPPHQTPSLIPYHQQDTPPPDPFYPQTPPFSPSSSCAQPPIGQVFMYPHVLEKISQMARRFPFPGGGGQQSIPSLQGAPRAAQVGGDSARAEPSGVLVGSGEALGVLAWEGVWVLTGWGGACQRDGQGEVEGDAEDEKEELHGWGKSLAVTLG